MSPTSKSDGRGRLTRAAFADAGLALVDEGGFEALTLKALGERLGVDSTALYRHFRNKDDLVEAMLARMYETMDVSIPDDGTPRDRLLALMRGLRRAFAAHPRMALPNLTAHDEKATADIVRAALALLEEMGLRDRDLLACYQMLETFSVGGNAYEFADYPQAHDRRLRSRRLVGHEVTARYSADVAQVAEIDDVAFEIAAGALLDACEERGRRTHEG